MPPQFRVTPGGGYRDYALSGPKRRRPGRWLAALVVLGALGAAAAYGLSVLSRYRALERAFAAAQAGRLAEAEQGFLALEHERGFASAAGDGLGLVALYRGDTDEARRRFAAAGKTARRVGGLDLEGSVREFLDRGDYPRAEVLAEQARARKDGALLRLYHGIALNGLDRLGPAREAMAGGAFRSVFERVRRGDNLLVGGVFKDKDTLELYAAHVRSLVDKERSGRRAYLYDRSGKPLFRVGLKNGEAGLNDPALRAAVFGAGGGAGLDGLIDDTDRRNRVETTLDPGVQRAAFDALRNYRGAVVVLAPDGAVLAAAARDGRRRKGKEQGQDQGKGGAPPDPFRTLFDAASLCKVPALGAALGAGVVEAVLPYTCKGRGAVGGKPFYDARPHGSLDSVGRALAVSCNLAFAELGLKVGGARLSETFRAFGFDGTEGGPLTLRPLGRLDLDPASERQVGELAAGFKRAEATTAGAAALALTIAAQGEWKEPYAIRKKATVGGRVYAEARPERRRALEPAVAERVKGAMLQVVLDEEGTGRRARTEGLPLAAKTGTSGGGRRGFDAVFAGFAPADAPRYAFAIYLIGGERAEWDGALAARALLEGLKAVEEERRREQMHSW